MARDRKRAKQRRGRRGAAALARREAADGRPQPPTGQTVRSDLPGSLDHAGAEVDEFDAALVAGAGGVPLAPSEQEELERQALDSDLDLAEVDASQEGAPPAGPPAEPPDSRPAADGGERAKARSEAGVASWLRSAATRSLSPAPARSDSCVPAGPSSSACSGRIAVRSSKRPPSS